MTERMTMTVPGRPEYVGTVRMAIAHAAAGIGFDLEQIDDMKVAVSEACTNIICHAHDTSDFTYDIVWEIEESGAAITVIDKGVGFGVEDYVEPLPGELNGSGLGLFIIKALMDEVDIESKPGAGTIIKMTKNLRNQNL